MPDRLAFVALAVACCLPQSGWCGDSQPDVSQRFADPAVTEIPDFQRHVSPLLGRLGCNGRACHGSFQGQGGFRLSLFGYDFQADHRALLDSGSTRVDTVHPRESLILTKPTNAEIHEGGLRYELDSWQYHLLRRWIEGGARPADQEQKMVLLEILPGEILATDDTSVSLQAIAVWQDGTREDVTPLCRFQSNNTDIAQVNVSGRVTVDQPGDTHVVVFYDNAVVPVPVLRPVSDRFGSRYEKVPTPTRVDELVVEKLQKLGIQPSELCDDASFLRRVSLDITGTLPATDEVVAFLADPSADKRQRKIDQLLASPAYASWWATKLCDWTGNNSRELVNLTPDNFQPSAQWYQWVRHRVAQNVPYDQIVEGILLATDRDADQGYTEYCEMMSDICRLEGPTKFAELSSMPYFWMRRNYQDPESRAISFAHAFLGVRMQCAQCHKHPFDQWTQADFRDLSHFFRGVLVARNGVSREDRQEYQAILDELKIEGRINGQTQQRVNQLFREGKTIPFAHLALRPPVQRAPGNRNQRAPRVNPVSSATILGSWKVDFAEHRDVRQPLMDWLRDPENEYFSHSLVNRVWAAYFGLGIVEPADDLSKANPPSNAALLDYLADGFRHNGYDMKWLHREIVGSRTYQSSWEPNESNAQDRRNFSRALPRRLPAEVIYDAIDQATAGAERNLRFRDDVAKRAISIPGTVGRRPGNERGDANFALSIFGRSTRSNNCDCDRSADVSLIQTVYLQNDRDIYAAILHPDGWLREIATRDPQRDRAENEQRRIQRAQQTLGQLRAQRDQAARAQQTDRLQQLERAVERGQRQLNELRQRVGGAVPQLVLDPLEQEVLIVDAYLRTLSRFPSNGEIERCLEFFQQDADDISGAAGILWALLNTKEFIVNH